MGMAGTPRRRTPFDPGRRRILRHGLALLGLALSGAAAPAARGGAVSANRGSARLQGPDKNGLLLPPGVTSRIIARSGQEPPGTSGYPWHPAPDGGALFPGADGGWVYVSNSEMHFPDGGVGALRFDAAGTPLAAYPLLQGSDRNCAGGPTPWGTWLSCEEVPAGRVWECDPLGRRPASAHPALGLFRHEAVAVDPDDRRLYLTEDEPDGRLYRFTPDTYPNLSGGRLEVARVAPPPEGLVAWLAVPDPAASSAPTRRQVPDSTAFNGGEGIWYRGGRVYFTTKGDDRVWVYHVAAGALTILYDAARYADPPLTGVDTITASPTGDLLVAEDGGDMQIVAISPAGALRPLVQIVGHPLSEMTGPALHPSGTRLYFSSQRGATGSPADGVTYELSGALLG